MNIFIHDDFLLRSGTARRLYHDYAANAPVIDYHCHLDPADLAADRQYANIGQLWVTGDPYKHRAMRIAGVPECDITGDASDRVKFDRWAATVPMTLGNPLHHWTALELKRFFDIDEPLTPATADRVWQVCNERLADGRYSARGLLAQARVECVCTSDRLLDDLAPHIALAGAGGGLRVLPSLRADDVVAVDSPDFTAWVRQLATATGEGISDYASYCAAVGRRLDEFSLAGCRLSDHGLDEFFHVKVSETEVAELFSYRLRGEMLTPAESAKLRFGLLRFLGREYARRGWVMQLHVGAHRRTSSRLRRLVGPAGGYAGIGRQCNVAALSSWLDELEELGGMPRTIIYPLNPADFVPVAVLAGSFVEDGVPGKLQLGPAWWFNDHASGMRAQFDAIANYGLLAVSMGMTTDARCPLSMRRQEYFRRVFCDWLGEQVQSGAVPANFDELGALVRAVAGGNARRFLSL